MSSYSTTDTFKNLTDLQQAVAAAKKGTDPKAIKDAQKSLDDYFKNSAPRSATRNPYDRNGTSVADAAQEFIDTGRRDYFGNGKNFYKYDKDGTDTDIDFATECDTTDKDSKLREILMAQLYEMSQQTSKPDDEGTGCAFACGEDAELDRMQQMYSKFHTSLSTGGASASGLCGIGDFKSNPRIQVLESQRTVLEFVSFGFLHQTCEGTNNCNPYQTTVPKELLKCCGLYEGAPLFYDGDLQAVGSYLAGPQGSPKGLTPAANGHCANFYMSGTIAPGRDKQLYVNVCYVASASERGAITNNNATKAINVGMKWVKANRLERAKFEAMREIDAKIIAAKRMVLQMNHKMLQLQQSLVGLNPNSMGGGAGTGVSSDEFLTNRLKAVVQSSAQRVRNNMGRRFGAMEDKRRSMIPGFDMRLSPQALGRNGSELRAIDSLRRRRASASVSGRRAASRRSASSRASSRAGSRASSRSSSSGSRR